MKKYSIKEVEKLTGIKAHTIRIWEKRYNLCCAARTETNIRFYSDQELKKLINIAVLVDNGRKISKLVSLDSEALNAEITKLVQINPTAPRLYIDRFVKAMIDMNEPLFHEILAECSGKFGFERCVTEVIYPFLERVGVLWQTNHISPVQEHFISNLIRQKILAETDKIEYSRAKGKTFLLFLPVNELHEIGLLFYNYFLRMQGNKVYYFGQSVPFKDVAAALKQIRVDYIMTYFVSGKSQREMSRYLHDLENVFEGKHIFVMGLLGCNLQMENPGRCMKIDNFPAFREYMKKETV